jgi:DNA repair protein RadA/Sms
VEGTRPLLIEIQALVSPSGFGNPRRTALGIDTNRGNIILAVLEKRAGLQLSGCDVYLNVVGGIRLDDTAADLAIAIAAASSLRDKPVPPRTMVFGEIGLSGELRAVARADSRLKEAAKLGFETVVMPEGNASGMDDSPGMKIIAPRNVEEALLSIFS